MVSHALPRMQWALAGAKRLECGSLLPLCLYAQTTCLSPYRVMKSPVRGACLKGTKLSKGTLWVTNPTRQRLTTSRKRVLRSCQQWQHEA